jgi:hypothetical protein
MEAVEERDVQLLASGVVLLRFVRSKVPSHRERTTPPWSLAPKTRLPQAEIGDQRSSSLSRTLPNASAPACSHAIILQDRHLMSSSEVCLVEALPPTHDGCHPCNAGTRARSKLVRLHGSHAVSRKLQLISLKTFRLLKRSPVDCMIADVSS